MRTSLSKAHNLTQKKPFQYYLMLQSLSSKFDSMLALVKEYIIDLWEVRKVTLYGEPCSIQPQSQSSAGDLRDGTVVGGKRRGKFGKFSHSGRVTGKLSTCDSCKTGSAYTGRVVNGRIARAAS